MDSEMLTRINKKSNQPRKLFLTRWHLLIIILLLLGVFFRFVNLDRAVYWGDETITSLRISGYTLEEFKKQAFKGDEIGVEDLQKYQYPNPEKSVINTINGLAAEEPQHPPLYFVMARFWVQWFGNSVAVTRSLSALISLLAFPCIYWLCQELFGWPLTGWVAIAIIAVSPFQVLYAQEARSYSLWAVIILSSSAALLRSVRLGTKLGWGIYALTMALGLYTFLFSGLVAIGHSIYVVFNEGFRFSKTVRAYLLAYLAVIFLFIPWIIVVIANFSAANQTTMWTKEKVLFASLVQTWVLNIIRIFFDMGGSLNFQNYLFFLLSIIIIILVGYSIYYLCRQTERRVWSFVLALIGSTMLGLAIPDLILGGMLSGVARYLIPCYLGIQVAVAYLIAAKITSMSVAVWQQKLWCIITIVVISVGILSCTVKSQAETWWNKEYVDIHYPALAKIVNQTDHPLVITHWLRLLTLSHVIDPKVRLQSEFLQSVLMPNGKIRNRFVVKPIADGFSDVFVYNSPRAVEDLLGEKHNYRIEKVYQWEQQIEPVHITKGMLWKIAKR